MQIRRLYLGSIAGPLGPATPFNGFLLDHPKGLTLIDTGFGRSLALLGGATGEALDARAGAFVINDVSFPWIRRPTTEALADHGIEPIDVKYIINTHVGDHSGDNHLFPHATFIIQQPEIEWGRTRQGISASRDEWEFPGAKIEMLQGEDVERPSRRQQSGARGARLRRDGDSRRFRSPLRRRGGCAGSQTWKARWEVSCAASNGSAERRPYH